MPLGAIIVYVKCAQYIQTRLCQYEIMNTLVAVDGVKNLYVEGF